MTTTNLINIDKWDSRVINSLIDSHEDIADAVSEGPQGLYEDLWASYFKPVPRVDETSEAPWKSIVETMMDTPEYSSTHDICMLDENLAAYAAGASFNELNQKMEENPKFDKFMRSAPGSSEKDVREELMWLPAQIANKVGKEVQELKDALEMSGYSKDAKNKPEKLTLDGINEIKSRLNSKTMKKVMQLWGRMKNLAAAIQRKKTIHGVDEIDEVGVGNNLNRILPIEILNWKLNPQDFRKRYQERRLNQISMKGVEPKGKGPIIALVDTSGSMYGDKIQWAKALAVTLFEIGKKQKRNVILHDFALGDETYDISYTGSSVDSKELFNWVEHFYGGGTNWDYPLNKALTELKSQNFKDGQILLITDGKADVSSTTLAEIEKQKKDNNVSVKAVVIGDNIASLNKFCDEVINITAVTNDSKTLDRVFNV